MKRYNFNFAPIRPHGLRLLAALAPILAVGVLMACTPGQSQAVGGPCSYAKIPGVITITAIEPAPGDENNCKDAVKVFFTFTPTDPAAGKKYAFPNWSDEKQVFTVGGGANPNRDWVKSKGMTVGAKFDASRNEILSGTCTPVIFEFTSIDVSDFTQNCH